METSTANAAAPVHNSETHSSRRLALAVNGHSDDVTISAHRIKLENNAAVEVHDDVNSLVASSESRPYLRDMKNGAAQRSENGPYRTASGLQSQIPDCKSPQDHSPPGNNGKLTDVHLHAPARYDDEVCVHWASPCVHFCNFFYLFANEPVAFAVNLGTGIYYDMSCILQYFGIFCRNRKLVVDLFLQELILHEVCHVFQASNLKIFTAFGSHKSSFIRIMGHPRAHTLMLFVLLIFCSSRRCVFRFPLYHCLTYLFHCQYFLA